MNATGTDAHTDPVEALTDAEFVTADAPRSQAVRLHKRLLLEQAPGAVRSATLYATALGVYAASLDGIAVSESVLDPGWSAYEWRINVAGHDVTHALRRSSGSIELDVVLGNGWYRGGLGFESADADYGAQTALCAALVITYEDGRKQQVVTDEDWTAWSTDIVRNSLYDGQTIDARLRHQAPHPYQVQVLSVDHRRLVAQSSPPVTRHEVVAPAQVWTSPSGRTLVDFGQNLVGWIRMRAQGRAGQRVTIRHAEVLEDGELGVRPLRAARAVDEFILSGHQESFEPMLTFHGFRYIEVDGWPDDLAVDDLEAVVVHSHMRRTGWFSCSEPLVNQLVHNSMWSQKGNFLSLPTDCPQRDERLGWTGDIAAYAASAAFQFDIAGFLGSWLQDLRAETEHAPGQVVPMIVPDVLKYASFPRDFPFGPMGPTAIWSDAAVWVPEALWNAYGDREALAAQYPAMALHLHGVQRSLSPEGLWTEGFQFGDWLDPDASPHDPAAAKADPHVVATACLFRSARFAASAARELGLGTDAERWTELADQTREAFLSHYVDEDGRVVSDCATVYALAIYFGVLSDPLRARAGDRLAQIVRDGGYRVTTGFAGTPFVTWALSETGHVDDAYRLLLERDCPSWLYPVTMGATTVWERWDSMLPDGTINPGEMTSFNHYALGAVVDWIYQVVGGIRPAQPGYKRARIQPVPGPGITWAKTAHETPAGRIDVSWSQHGVRFDLDVSLPDRMEADVILPDGSVRQVVGGTHRFTVDDARMP